MMLTAERQTSMTEAALASQVDQSGSWPMQRWGQSKDICKTIYAWDLTVTQAYIFALAPSVQRWGR